MRSARVFTPRRQSQQSNGPGTAPAAFWTNCSRSEAASSLLITTPPTMSLWPFRYFVVLCTTRCAPSSIGRWKKGVMNVLSTTRRAFFERVSFASARRSEMIMEGLVGVSMKSIRVAGRKAFPVASRSPVFT